MFVLHWVSAARVREKCKNIP